MDPVSAIHCQPFACLVNAQREIHRCMGKQVRWEEHRSNGRRPSAQSLLQQEWPWAMTKSKAVWVYEVKQCNSHRPSPLNKTCAVIIKLVCGQNVKYFKAASKKSSNWCSESKADKTRQQESEIETISTNAHALPNLDFPVITSFWSSWLLCLRVEKHQHLVQPLTLKLSWPICKPGKPHARSRLCPTLQTLG